MRSLGRSIKKFSADDMLVYASAVSYQVFFSLFPFIIFLLALLGFLYLQPVFDFLLQHSKTVMPQSAFSMLQSITQQIQSQASGGVMSLGAILALWSASSAVRMAMHALNIAYDAYSPECVERPSEKGYERYSERGFGKRREAKMGRKLPFRCSVRLHCRLFRPFSDSLGR